MRSNPSQVGGKTDGPGERREPLLRWQWGLRVLGLAKIFEAVLEILVIFGSLWFTVRIGEPGIRRAMESPRFVAYLIERFLVLPALVALSVWVARDVLRSEAA